MNNLLNVISWLYKNAPAIIPEIIALKVKPIKKLPPVEKTLLVRISLIAIATPVNHGPK